MGKRPIVEAMMRFNAKQNISFHVPGHKHGALSELPVAFKDVMNFDYTELAGLDDYHHPEEMIKEAQDLLAQTYGAKQSHFLVNGSTVGNLAMIYASCAEGDLVLVQRNAHKSIFHAVELVGANPIFLTPEWDEETHTPTHVSTGTVKAALEAYPTAKALVLTYPTYYGVASPMLAEVISLAHSFDVPVLVDEAHGAHFAAGGEFPASALELGADVVVQSAHKTLPALTMGSYLHINSERVSPVRINRYLRMLQSSSPSYLLLASLDDARDYIGSYAHEDYKAFAAKRRQFLDSLNTIAGLRAVEVDDPLKILLRLPAHSGYTFMRHLESEGVFAELADPEQILLVLPLLKSWHHFPFAEIRMKIKRAAEACLKKPEDKPRIDYTHDLEPLSSLGVSYRDLNVKEVEWMPFAKSAGRICAGTVIPYPPGIPLLVRGERITTAKLKMLGDYLAAGSSIQGEHRLEQNELLVLRNSNN